MQRASYPVEIILGFVAGCAAALVVEQPLIWFLHQLGVTARDAFSTQPTLPMGVQAVWSRTFWGGCYGLLLGWIGTRYVPGEHDAGSRYIWAPALVVAAVRTGADWFVVPLFWRHAWAGWGVDPLVTPLVLNLVWALATAALLAGASLVIGTWGTRSPIDF